MIKIGDFARAGRVSVKTLRHYARLGLLQPAWVDRWTGYRYYSLEQLARLNRILALKDLGFSLDEVRGLLERDLPASEMRGMLHLKRSQLERAIGREQARLARVEARLRHLEASDRLPPSDVVLKCVPARQVLGIRGTIPAYEQVGRLFRELEAYLQRHCLQPPADAPRLAIYFDSPAGEGAIEAEAAVPWTGSTRTAAPALLHELPGAEQMACVVHQAGLESLGETYRSAMAWIESGGFRVAGPAREVYLREPVPPEGSVAPIIDVQIPVERKPIYEITRKEGGEMEPKIVHRPAFQAVGMEYQGTNEHNEIKDVWGAFWPRHSEIKHIVWDWGTYGICRDWPEAKGLNYLAAVEVQRVEDVPEGMTAWQVPEQTYAVFPCTLPTIHEAYRHAFEDWMPTSGYRRGSGPDFELYTDEFDAEDPESRLYIYVPVEK
jgi:predicted transcriptional regulator YdeE/DNA-binding transcriptional MerR regulator